MPTAVPESLRTDARTERRFVGAVRALASIRLTVLLLACAMVLVFVGTIAQAHAGVWAVVDRYFHSFFVLMDVGGVRVPWPGGWALSCALIVNLLAAHAVRFRLSARRLGIVLLHAGLIVLLLGDIAAGLGTREGVVLLREVESGGESAGSVGDVRDVELAIDSDDASATVTGEALRSAARAGAAIELPEVGLRLRVDRWMDNAAIFERQEMTDANPGVPAPHEFRGMGRSLAADERPTGRGVDDAVADTPAAVLTLENGDGVSIGTWLVSAQFTRAQRVPVHGGDLAIALRFERLPLPFELELVEFEHDWFPGTDVPRSFVATVRLIDRERGVDRRAVIEMNRPLRYRGWSVYIAAYEPDGPSPRDGAAAGASGGGGAVFQAVQNPARALPYVAGAMVTAGLLWQFGWSLVAYLRRRRGREAGQGAVDLSGSCERLLGVRGKLMVLAVGFAIALSGVVRQPAPDGVGGAVFAALPVSAGGRVKPVDSAARSVLVLVSGRQDVEMFGERAAASEFLLDLIADPTRVADVPIVRVEEPGVLALLGRSPSERGLVSLSEIDAAWAEVVRASDRASLLGEHARDAFDDAVLLLRGRAELLRAVSRLDEPFVVAPLDDGAAWRPFGSDADAAHPSEAYWRAMLGAHRDGNAAEFAAFAREYQRLLAEELPDATRRADVEVLLNRAQPFVGAAAVYVLAGIAVGTSFLIGGGLSGRLRASALLLMLAAFSVHTLAIVVRVYLQERPPVTNLYSSAVFVGWGSVLAAMFFERAHKLGVALLVGSAVGFGSLVVAHNLAGSGDTMAMMQAVLDSNLWLASHVVTITLGYSLAFLAGALGCVRLVWDALPGGCPRDRSATLSRMVYGAVCAALLLSFAGTMLGGVWADQAWGRFWGWDPKENGAALVVLMNAVILHARFGGLVGARGVAALAVVGNIVTAWSWFGTNLLGVGLHSYGFIDGAAGWLWLFCGANALVAMLVFAPPRRRRRAGVTSA